MKEFKVFRWLLVLVLFMFTACASTPAGGDLPTTPANFKVSSSNATSITLTWDLVSGATGYILERATGSSAKVQIATPLSTTSTYTDTGLTAGTSYGYALKAVNAKGNSEAAITAGLTSVGGGDTDADGVSDADEAAGWDVVIARGGTQISTRHVSSDPTKADTDSDGLTDAQERTRFTDPNSDDTDADSLKDAAEVNTWVSNPVDVDTDNDSNGNSALYDGNELSTYGTSPTLADTDGDGLSDHQEAIVLGNTFKPLIANTPRFELSFASAPTISLSIVKTSDQSLITTKTSSLSLSASTSKSSTDTSTERYNAEISTTVGVEVSGGLDGGVTVSGSVTATAGYGTENTKSFTSDSSRSTEQTAEDARTLGSTAGQQIGGANMTVGFTVRNTSGVAFTLSNTIISVLRRNSSDASKFILIGNMNTLSSLTLGAGETSGSLAATYTFTNADEALEVMRNPANLRFELAGYDILDGSNPPRSFKFQNDTTNGQTAQIVIDYGNGDIVRQRVATNVERVNGQIVGVKLGKVLTDILKLPYTTTTDTVTGLKVINGVKDALTNATVSSKTASDPKSVWVVVGSSGLTVTGANADEILIKSGSEVRLILARDNDTDGLLESEEYFYETSDSNPDTDGDGLTDFAEVRTGWTVSVIGKPALKFFANPKTADSDNDSFSDSQEKTAGTNPLNPDTDGDGTTDSLDTEPLNPASAPVISNFNTSLVAKTVTVTATVTNTNLKNTVINWGDTTTDTLIGAAAKTVSIQHTYANSGVFTIVLTASDSSTPVAKTASQNATLDIKDITSNLFAWYKFNGPLSSSGSTTISSSGGAITDSSGNGKNATADCTGCVLTDAGKFDLVNTAFRFNFNSGGLGCGTDAHGSVTAPNLGFSQNFTFSAWIKPQGSLGGNWIMGQADSTGSNPWVRMRIGSITDPNNSSITYGTDSTVSIILPVAGGIVVLSDPSAVPLDAWNHFAATVSLSSGTTTVRLYRNGTEVASKTLASTTMTNPSSTAKFLIGNGAQGGSGNGGISLFKGVIDNVRVYGRALTVSEVNTLKDAPEN